MATTQQPQVDFVKAISRLDATALVVGSMIGSGIFIVSAEILREVHAPGLLLVVWAASGVVTLMGALSYGELAAMFPKAGGQYVYLREGISPLFGYLYGWTLFVVIQTGTIAAVAVAFARFASVFWPGLSPDVFLGFTMHFPQPIGDIAVGLSPQRILAVLSVALLPWINVRGVRTAALIQASLTAIAGAPQDRVGTAALQAILGEPGLKLMAAAIMISTFGCNNGLILSGARVYYAMARDDLFFKSAGVLHPEYKTPAVALVVQAVWTSLLCLSGTYTQLLNFVIFAALVFYGLTAGGLFALRAKRPAAGLSGNRGAWCACNAGGRDAGSEARRHHATTLRRTVSPATAAAGATACRRGVVTSWRRPSDSRRAPARHQVRLARTQVRPQLAAANRRR